MQLRLQDHHSSLIHKKIIHNQKWGQLFQKHRILL